jgi:hypothetical protein
MCTYQELKAEIVLSFDRNERIFINNQLVERPIKTTISVENHSKVLMSVG